MIEKKQMMQKRPIKRNQRLNNLFYLMFFCLSSYSQNSIFGKVTCIKDSLHGIEGVTIYVVSDKNVIDSTITSANGKYKISLDSSKFKRIKVFAKLAPITRIKFYKSDNIYLQASDIEKNNGLLELNFRLNLIKETSNLDLVYFFENKSIVVSDSLAFLNTLKVISLNKEIDSLEIKWFCSLDEEYCLDNFKKRFINIDRLISKSKISVNYFISENRSEKPFKEIIRSCSGNAGFNMNNSSRIELIVKLKR